MLPDRPSAPDRLLTIEQLAAHLQVPVKTLYDWRHRGIGPKGLRVGRYIRYRPADINSWLDTRAERERIS
jgi:predicted DNA-binding transcriptional regulator AlpA